jgi:cytochrome P450
MLVYDSIPRSAILTVAAAVAFYLGTKLLRHIKFNYWARTSPDLQAIPHYPQNWLLGNLINVGKYLDPSLPRHVDVGFEELWKDLDCPAHFWFDMGPVGMAVLVNAGDPALAEAVSEPRPGFRHATPKSDTALSLDRVLGRESMVLIDGEKWRTHRRRFNKGFSPAHIHSLTPMIVEHTQTFVERLKRLAKTGETFQLRDYTADLTTDIITTVVLDKNLGAQTTRPGQGEKSRFGIFKTSQILAEQVYRVGQGFSILQMIDPIRPMIGWLNETILNRRLYKIISEQMSAAHEESTGDEKPSTRSRSIVSLASDSPTPSHALITNTVSQVKTFFFAGSDTTSTTIQWLCYELAKCTTITPCDPLFTHYKALYAALLHEHDTVFPSSTNDPFSALSSLLSSPTNTESTLNTHLPITTAWIKEALRLHPPGSSARIIPFESSVGPNDEGPTPLFTIPASPPSKFSSNPDDRKHIKINGLRVYTCQYLIHRSPNLYGPNSYLFNPHRWLAPSSTSSSSSPTQHPPTTAEDQSFIARLPVGAYRPFERGPRNCIGQTLAMVEATVVLVAIARGLVWEKVGGNGGVNGEREMGSVFRVTSVPQDDMLMRVRLKTEGEVREDMKVGKGI